VVKESKVIELDSKYKIKEAIEKVTIGKEVKKIVPTDMGKKVNEFLMSNFNSIMEIDFTSDFETYLDKIAEGKANWVTVFKKFL
jgi:DNA topoisomerase-1